MTSPLLVLALTVTAQAVAGAGTLANFPNAMVYAVQTDAAGNLYVAGFQGDFAKADPFVAKLSPAGNTLYSTTLTGSNFGIAWAIAVDSNANAYIFGNTNSPDFPVTPGALQTTMQGSFQGFVTKLGPTGNIVYSTFVGGATQVTPGVTSAPGLDSILVDSAGDVFITGQASVNPTTGAFPPAPAPVVSGNGSFVLEIDPAGTNILGGISGVGGMIAMDGQGDIYVTGLQYGNPENPVPVTSNAFQSEPANVCGLLGPFFSCSYQYVAKLNPGLNQVLYSTYLTGKYGATPAAISVDAKGDAFVVGTTNSPDYPTTPGAYEPEYIASVAPSTNCFFTPNCVNLPPASGYLSEVNPTGTGLVYSTFFSGTQTDTINFAAFTPSVIYLGGTAGSADLPGFAGYQQCLPQPYETRLSPDGTEVGASRVVAGKILAYDAFAGTLITTDGTNVTSVNPTVSQSSISCILDSADLKPVTSVAPGELLSIFGDFSTGNAATPAPGQTSTSLDQASVTVNGIASSLLYVGGEQINFQIPFGAVGQTQASIQFASALSGNSGLLILPVVASNPAAFLSTATPSPALATCNTESSASVNGTPALMLNADGSVNTCLNPAAQGSTVTMFLNGLGATSAPVVSANDGMTVASVSMLGGPISGIWQVNIQVPGSAGAGGNQISVTAGGVAVRDTNLIIWVK